MQVSILEGAYFDTTGNIRPSMPINMQPVIVETGFSKGYLRTAAGLAQVGQGPGQDRGSIVWKGVHYRVMGAQLVSIASGNMVQLGNVGNDGKPVRFDYGFDRLALYSAGGLYYYVNGGLVKVTDPNLGNPIDVCWIDGYYMLTDGTYLYVTQLADPTTINALAYESPPEDPSPVVAVMRVRDEIYAVTTNSIQNFQNVGGIDFPFQVNPSGLIPKGAVGTHAVCYFNSTLAFVGSGRNEALSVYIAGFGVATQISTPEVDHLLAQLTTAQQAAIEIEAIVRQDEQRLLVHLPNVTLVYHYLASQSAQKPIWTQLAGGQGMNQAYPARHFAYDGQYWVGGSPTGQLGRLDDAVQTQFQQATSWQFDTLLQYNQGKGAILYSAEVVGTPGLAEPGVTAIANLSWTKDGQTWSSPQSVSMGASGSYLQRMQWRPKTRFRSIMGLRTSSSSPVIAAFGVMELAAEPLNV